VREREVPHAELIGESPINNGDTVANELIECPRRGGSYQLGLLPGEIGGPITRLSTLLLAHVTATQRLSICLSRFHPRSCLSMPTTSLTSLTVTMRPDSGDKGDDEESQCSSEIEPFDHFQARILYHFSRIITATNPPLIIPRKGGGFNHITELSVAGENPNHGPTMRYIWRSPRFRGDDVTRTALMLRYLHVHTCIPVPNVLSFSGINKSISDRYILMELLPGIDLASVLDISCWSLKQRLDLAASMAELIADIHAITIPGQEGLIGNVCVEYSGEGRGGDDQHQHPNEDQYMEDGLLVVKTFPHDHSLDHDSYLSPNASDQHLSTPHTLRSFILARLQLHLDYARARKSEYFENLYLRLLAVAHTLLDPNRTPSVDVVCKSVFVHTDLMARNVLVQVDGDRGGDGDGDGDSGEADGGTTKTGIVRITGVLDWDTSEAAPPLAAYVSHNWLWDSEPDSGKTFSSWNEFDRDPDEGIDVMNPNNALIRQRFISSIEMRIPGYIETIRQGRRIGIKTLMGFARSVIRTTWEASFVHDLETLAEKTMRER